MSAETAKLGEVARYIRGITFKPGDKIEPGAPSAVTCMRTKNVQDELDQSDRIAVPPEFVRRQEQYLREGDILVSSANSWNLVGKCCWVPALDYQATAGGFISIVRARESKVTPRYLYHWLSSGRTQHAARHCARQTTNIANLSRERFLELALPLPPIDEQRRIAAILDKADAIRRKRRDAIAMTEELLQTAFAHTVGDQHPDHATWRPTPIAKLAVQKKGAIRSGPFGSALKHSEFVDEGIAVLGIDNAVQNRFAWDERRFITPEKYEKLRRYEVLPGDVIITIMGTTGRSAVVPDDIPEAITTKHLATITVDRSKARPEYVAHALHRDDRLLHQVAMRNRGAIMAGLNLGIIRELEVRLPPLRAQDAWVEQLARIEAMRTRLERAAAEADDLFHSLVQRAFAGEL